jgi:23S rRNA (pseudouridine1915-N3)-methyltransferase
MKIALLSITRRRSASKAGGLDELVADYLKRTARYCPIEEREFAAEEALRKALQRPGRTAPVLVALDSRGRQMTSEELAEFVRQQMERGTQELLFAIGPADGWQPESLAAAQYRLSLGKMTLPHELARVVMAEQLYRAFAILNHHPYHGGH